MPPKRHNTSSPESSPSLPVAKRRRTASAASKAHSDSTSDDYDYPLSKETPQVNWTSGQTNAFPGLGDEGGELFYGPAHNGIEYLRMVRSEARGVPSLLLAPDVTSSSIVAGGLSRTDTEEEGKMAREAVNEEIGAIFFEDGTCTAKRAAQAESHAMGYPPAQLRYYDSLLALFKLLQATLRCTPPLHLVQALDERTPISLPAESKKAEKQWKELLATREPNAVQLACMDTASVLRLISVVLSDAVSHLRQSDETTRKTLALWTWAALARCPDRGEMSSEEIAELRQLATQAVACLRDVNPEVSVSKNGELGKIEPSKPPVVGGSTAQHEAWKDDDDISITLSSKGMLLDMIVTVVGEIYGQRDLLERRCAWPGA